MTPAAAGSAGIGGLQTRVRVAEQLLDLVPSLLQPAQRQPEVGDGVAYRVVGGVTADGHQQAALVGARCEATTIEMPNSAPIRSISSSIAFRPAGSSPFVGSSSRSSLGSPTSAWASFTRCFMPVE